MPPKSSNSVAVIPGGLAPKDNRFLQPKEATLFKTVLQQYEAKQWTKGMKTADLILKVKPDHGETLAMKGLFMTCLGPDSKLEGYELVKRGVKMDMGSHIVWHVYGLLHRADKNFEEALKCYTQASKIEKDSMSILGDMATLTIHLRHYEAYVDARLSILRIGPRLRRNWIGLAVSQHLAKQYLEADRTLTSYEQMLREVPEREFDQSEVLLYHAMILEEGGLYERCLEFLSEHNAEIVDRQTYSVQRARLLLKLGRVEPAEWAWELLLEENPDSYEYIKSYVTAKGADFDAETLEGKAAALKVLDKLTDKFPRSLAIRRLALEIASGEEFRTKAAKYLTDALSKGVPSVFADVKSLYRHEEKRVIIGESVEKFRESLEATSTFGVSLDDEDASAETIESSAAYLWTLYFLAQHYSTLNQTSKAVSLIDLAISHTPSLPELTMLKARILKRGGDVDQALEFMSEARALDGQDRFLNSKNAKYFIRSDQVEEAEKVLGLFTKRDAPSPLEDLVDMQALWLLHEEGLSYTRQEKFALALKRYHQIFNIFAEIEEDQYDFHSYCLRKMTLRAYVDLLRYMDQLRSHPRYYAAAKGAIEIYLKIHDNPSVVPPPLTNGAAEAVEAEAEKKRKEALAKAKEVEEEKKKKAATKDKGKKAANKKVVVEEEEVVPPVVDLDPRGDELLQTKTPLEEALKFLKPLEKAASANIGTWVLSFEVAIRREKYLQALRALQTAQSIDPTSPTLHLLIVRFRVLVSSLSSLPEQVSTTLEAGFSDLLNGASDVNAFIAEGLQKRSTSPKQVLAGARAKVVVDESAKVEAEELVFQLLRDELNATLEDVVEAQIFLKELSSTRVGEFESGAATKFPFATAFKSPEEIKRRKTEAKEKSEKEEVLEEE